MKKLKKVIILSLIVLIAMFNKVDAHSVELDLDNLISLPQNISNLSGGTIYIDSKVTDYTLYYQFLVLDNNTYSQIEKIIEDGKEELENLKALINELDDDRLEVEQLLEIVNEKKAIYDNLVENSGEEDEIETAMQEYSTAVDNYNKKATEYNELLEERKTNYNNKLEEINNNINELTPMYNENNWKETDDGQVMPDTSDFSGEIHFVLWAKLVCSDGTTVYDEDIYTTTGTKVEIESISLSETSITLNEGESYNLTVNIIPEEATNKAVNWSSDNEDVAIVENGTVTAISEGTATITVSSNDGNLKATCEVTVKKKTTTEDEDNNDKIPVESIKLDKTTISLAKGSSTKLTATITPENATNKIVNWSSDNENVAKVENGTVTAISEGTATITAKSSDGNLIATCEVTVVPEDLSGAKDDPTVAPVPLPNTGNVSILFALVFLAVSFVIIFKIILKKYKDII